MRTFTRLFTAALFLITDLLGLCGTTNPPLPLESLPCCLPGTDLVARELAAYEGPFWEDESDEPLGNIAALVLENVGSEAVETASVTLVQGQRRLYFEATYVPPESTVLVLERDRAVYTDEPAFLHSSCISIESARFQTAVDISEVDQITLCVTNPTQETIKQVEIFYKHCCEDLYVGGITYSVVIGDLASGETRQFSPYRYVSGSSRIVDVRSR